jgi:hypothetical protein
VVTVVISLTASLIRKYQVGEINRSVTNQIELTFVAPAAMYRSTSSSATARRWPVGASKQHRRPGEGCGDRPRLSSPPIV